MQAKLTELPAGVSPNELIDEASLVPAGQDEQGKQLTLRTGVEGEDLGRAPADLFRPTSRCWSSTATRQVSA